MYVEIDDEIQPLRRVLTIHKKITNFLGATYYHIVQSNSTFIDKTMCVDNSQIKTFFTCSRDPSYKSHTHL